jgi:hypothetical protein
MEAVIVVRVVHLVACVVTAGTYAFFFPRPRGAATSTGSESDAREVQRWLQRLCGWGILLAAVSWVAWLALAAATMSAARPRGR